MVRALMAASMLALLAGCATLGQHWAGGIPCTAGPIILGKSDQLSDATARQIIALDEAGAKLCGWRAPGGS